MFSIKYYCTCKAGRFVGKSRLLCGYSTSQQCNIFIGCKPHGRISHTVCKLTTPLQISSANVGLSIEHLNCGFESHLGQDFFTFLCPLRRRRSELSYLGFGERVTRMPHSLKYMYIHLSYILNGEVDNLLLCLMEQQNLLVRPLLLRKFSLLGIQRRL